MESRGSVLIAAPVHKVLIEGLQEAGYTCVFAEKIRQEQAPELLAGCAGVVTSTRLQLDSALIDAAPKLRWIGRMGSGMEVIDTEYAQSKGIACYSSPEGNANAVGEHALGMLLALARNIVTGDREVRQGVWRREENRGFELAGKTVAIIGYGNAGGAFARVLSGFGVQLIAYDKYHKDGIPTHIERVNIEEIHERADVLSFHVPYGQETTHYFDRAFLESMKKPFILINTSRGVVVDTEAVLEGLKSGKIAGACLDVFEKEPISKAEGALADALQAVLAHPNVVVTPHIAGYTHEALYKMSNVLLGKIVSGL